MKHLLLSLLLIGTLGSPARARPPAHPPARAAAATTAAKVYVCGGGSAYAYHNSESCAGLNRCSHGVRAVSVAEAQGLGRRPCRKCY